MTDEPEVNARFQPEGSLKGGGSLGTWIFPDHEMALTFNPDVKTADGEFQPFALVWEDLFSAFARPGLTDE